MYTYVGIPDVENRKRTIDDAEMQRMIPETSLGERGGMNYSEKRKGV